MRLFRKQNVFFQINLKTLLCKRFTCKYKYTRAICNILSLLRWDVMAGSVHAWRWFELMEFLGYQGVFLNPVIRQWHVSSYTIPVRPLYSESPCSHEWTKPRPPAYWTCIYCIFLKSMRRETDEIESRGRLIGTREIKFLNKKSNITSILLWVGFDFQWKKASIVYGYMWPDWKNFEFIM